MEREVSTADLRRVMDELAEQTKETDRRMRETDRRLADLGKQIGGLGNRLGEFVEGVVRPGLVRLFRERGIDVRETHRDLEAERNGKKAQVDLLVVDDAEVVVVEVKSKLSQRDVEEHLERLALFKELFPRYADARVLGAMAAMVIPEKQAAFAEGAGLFVIGQAGDDAVCLNSEGFRPKAW
ncbi:MAG: DUF3782 domain-containing protein [Proteobacteria bacterium]|jgi:hypothetical protein|nr:DUF3782 domain-containing protein [Pseudomonadota bacterium]